jgi:hypothetical protein
MNKEKTHTNCFCPVEKHEEEHLNPSEIISDIEVYIYHNTCDNNLPEKSRRKFVSWEELTDILKEKKIKLDQEFIHKSVLEDYKRELKVKINKSFNELDKLYDEFGSTSITMVKANIKDTKEEILKLLE